MYKQQTFLLVWEQGTAYLTGTRGLPVRRGARERVVPGRMKMLEPEAPVGLGSRAFRTLDTWGRAPF